MTKRYTRFFIFMLLPLFAGCALIFLGDSDFWRKDNIVFEGGVFKNEYDLMRIGSQYMSEFTKTKMNIKLPEVYIDWPNGDKVMLARVTVEMLQDSGFNKDTRESALPQKVVSYYWQGYCFMVYDGIIVSFQAGDHFIEKTWDHYGGIWNKTLIKYYRFPISRKELVELFGEADEMYRGYYTGSW